MHHWDAWLQAWNRELLSRYDPANYDFVDPQITPAAIASGWLGFPGASDTELAELEARLGTTLPTSYRSFLRASNGFLQPGVVVPRLLSINEVAWLRDVDPETIEIWLASSATGGAPDPEDFEQYLPTALAVSAVEVGGTAMYLLNPKVVSADGEWEAFFFAHWVPGVHRFPSFGALMKSELDDLLDPSPLPPPPSDWQRFKDTMKQLFQWPPERWDPRNGR